MSNIIDKIRVSGTDYTLSATSSGGNPTVELTQAEYDALVSAGTVSADTYYIITDAQAGDLTQYWTSAQTSSAITQAVSGKQDTLVSSVNIKTINNESILGSGNINIQGGGKAVSAGTNISITTGETADTINCTLNASNGNGDYSFKEGFATFANKRCAHAEGEQTLAGGAYSHAEGAYTTARADYSHTEGYNTNANNQYEHASGQYNVSNKANNTWGDSGNTLFSVGNGTSDSARHNAFEIRQNGDIYLSSGGTDIKLQDHLGGGGGATYSAGRGIRIDTANTISLGLAVYSSTGASSLVVNSSTNKAAEMAFAEGSGTKANGLYSHAEGVSTTATGQQSHVEGYKTIAKNNSEHASGIRNVSNTGSTTADKTLFSVGNGTADNARHNAFEIRQNGDIYLSNGTNDVKLQDYIQIKAVKISQSDYDQLQTKDPNTLYIITTT